MRQCFVQNRVCPKKRPTPQQWVQALAKVEEQLVECQHYPLHVYSKHLKTCCPWCIRMEKGIPNPFPATGTTMLIPGKTRVCAPAPGPRRPSAHVPVSVRNGPAIPLPRRLALAGIAFLCLLLYIAEGIIAYYLRSYGHLFLQVGPLAVTILSLVFFLVPLIVFAWLIRRYS
jgi:DNA-binding helix-hairpin-helix protein with protein kinase domain